MLELKQIEAPKDLETLHLLQDRVENQNWKRLGSANLLSADV